MDYDDLPKHIKVILDTFDEQKDGYEECARLLTELETLGLTFDYGLDVIPFNFRKL